MQYMVLNTPLKISVSLKRNRNSWYKLVRGSHQEVTASDCCSVLDGWSFEVIPFQQIKFCFSKPRIVQTKKVFEKLLWAGFYFTCFVWGSFQFRWVSWLAQSFCSNENIFQISWHQSCNRKMNQSTNVIVMLFLLFLIHCI